MKTFREIETEHGSVPVSCEDPSYPASGYLSLRGTQTEVVLQSDEPFHGQSDENGWFQLRLRGASRQSILLHHALVTSSRSFMGRGAGGHETRMFPNAVLFGADVLAEGDTVRELAFSFTDADQFFHYQHVEHAFLWPAPAELKSALRKLRRPAAGRYDRFKPREIYVVHDFPPVFRFRLEDRRYEIFIGSRSIGGSWNRIEHQTQPIARIRFDAPEPLESAIELAWSFKRWFSTIALHPIGFTGLTVISGTGRRTREGHLYLPNNAEQPAPAGHRAQLWPGNAPLNRWEQRGALAEALRSWFAHAPGRTRFRGGIESVSGERQRRTSLDDVMTLCAGIESLDELTSSSGLTEEQVRIVADAAVAAASANRLPIPENRLRGLMGSLRHQGLAQRLRALLARVPLPAADRELLALAVMRLRNRVAHGAERGEMDRQAGPAIDGLLAACAVYDLVTCGVPARSRSNQPLPALSELSHAVEELRAVAAGVS